jgi:hypothetical protein
VWNWKILEHAIKPGLTRAEVEGKLGHPSREVDFLGSRRASYLMSDNPIRKGENPKDGEYLAGVTITYDATGVVKHVNPDVMVISRRR